MRHRAAGLLLVGILVRQGGAEPDRIMKGSDDKIASLDRTVLRVGDADVAVTLADVKAIQAALLDYLKRSDYGDRDELIGWTRGPAWIDTEGMVRIGPWLLGSTDKQIYLRYREAPGRLAARAHKALLARKDGKWTVTDVVMEKIRVLSPSPR